MVIFGALQPGVPSSMAIPPDSYKIVIDLKDCFFSIPLNPGNIKRFAFSVPVVNFKEPIICYQRKVLPQGMANNYLVPKIVVQVIEPVWLSWPQLYLFHYMDDLLIAGIDTMQVFQFCHMFTKNLANAGFQIASHKIQFAEPYSFLGFQLYKNQVLTQKIQLKTSHLKTLHYFQ